jgi:hypothetical protein
MDGHDIDLILQRQAYVSAMEEMAHEHRKLVLKRKGKDDPQQIEDQFEKLRKKFKRVFLGRLSEQYPAMDAGESFKLSDPDLQIWAARYYLRLSLDDPSPRYKEAAANNVLEVLAYKVRRMHDERSHSAAWEPDDFFFNPPAASADFQHDVRALEKVYAEHVVTLTRPRFFDLTNYQRLAVHYLQELIGDDNGPVYRPVFPVGAAAASAAAGGASHATASSEAAAAKVKVEQASADHDMEEHGSPAAAQRSMMTAPPGGVSVPWIDADVSSSETAPSVFKGAAAGPGSSKWQPGHYYLAVNDARHYIAHISRSKLTDDQWVDAENSNFQVAGDEVMSIYMKDNSCHYMDYWADPTSMDDHYTHWGHILLRMMSLNMQSKLGSEPRMFTIRRFGDEKTSGLFRMWMYRFMVQWAPAVVKGYAVRKLLEYLHRLLPENFTQRMYPQWEPWFADADLRAQRLAHDLRVLTMDPPTIEAVLMQAQKDLAGYPQHLQTALKRLAQHARDKYGPKPLRVKPTVEERFAAVAASAAAAASSSAAAAAAARVFVDLSVDDDDRDDPDFSPTSPVGDPVAPYYVPPAPMSEDYPPDFDGDAQDPADGVHAFAGVASAAAAMPAAYSAAAAAAAGADASAAASRSYSPPVHDRDGRHSDSLKSSVFSLMQAVQVLKSKAEPPASIAGKLASLTNQFNASRTSQGTQAALMMPAPGSVLTTLSKLATLCQLEGVVKYLQLSLADEDDDYAEAAVASAPPSNKRKKHMH